MNRRDSLETAGLPDANERPKAAGAEPVSVDHEQLGSLQQLMGYSDGQFGNFLKKPRNIKMLSHIQDCMKTRIVFEIVKSHGCIAGHKVGETFLFPAGGPMDTRNSAEKLCPFLMPPMTRLVWIVQERIWEGLEPTPLFYMGQCDDVGYDCDGLGRVVVKARVERNEAEAG